VRPGDHVRRGQCLGLCGNSGNSDSRHVHFSLVDRPDESRICLASRLSNFTLHRDGFSVRLTEGVPRTGDLVEKD